MDEYEKSGTIATETTLNIRTVASLTKEKYFYDKYAEAVETPYKLVTYVLFQFCSYLGYFKLMEFVKVLNPFNTHKLNAVHVGYSYVHIQGGTKIHV